MIAEVDIPAWAALLTAIFIVGGAMISLIGSIGLLRLPTFFDRIHAPTLSTSMGTAGTVTGSILFFSVLHSGLVVHELLIGFFVTITTPITLMVLARAALHRKRYEPDRTDSKRKPSSAE